MANNLSSKLVTLAFPALVVILSLCVFKLSAACKEDADCGTEIFKIIVCWNQQKCVKCDHLKSVVDGECRNKDGTKDLPPLESPGLFSPQFTTMLIVGAILFLLVTIGGILGSCFCCTCCPGYQCRKRGREKADQAAQPSQMMVNPYPAYSQQQMQSQYQNQYAAPPPGYTQYPNPNVAVQGVQGGNGPAQYPAQQYPVQQYPPQQYPAQQYPAQQYPVQQ